ncbi:MAG TPA: OsmC family protein [Candidatus Lokiarchaeia archaeon]|nr:OsmC family protein [Candidatus Lokiarchaeia archaeon]
MAETERVTIGISWEKDLIFKLDFKGIPNVPELHVDDTNKILDEMVGVSPARLLASAVAGCLSSSFLFCISKRNVQLDEFTAEAEAILGRNNEGRLRVLEITVNLIPFSSDPAVTKRLTECKKVFEKFCTITESVRNGIKVTVNVNTNSG